jgi:energy-coupling factor transporter ATP-binding protein EcfA2
VDPQETSGIGTGAAPEATLVTRVLSDAPTEKDELGRDRYVAALSDLALTAETPYVIAVYGAWGSGKTSLMRQMRRRIDPRYDRDEPPHRDGEVRTIWFDPWLHQFDQTPAIALLHAAMEQLGLLNKADVKETLKKIALALAEDIKIPYLGLQLGKLAKIRSEIANDEFNRREQQARLRKHFRDALAAAGAPKSRLVFFIDDLDRCHPKQTVQVLEALKLYLDVPGSVYILGVDRGPLEAAIGTEYKDLDIAATSYLDKIVQLPFALPAISEEAMRSFVESKMPPSLGMCTEILVTAGADDPRQVKRILNSLCVNDRLVSGALTDYQPQVLNSPDSHSEPCTGARFVAQAQSACVSGSLPRHGSGGAFEGCGTE